MKAFDVPVLFLVFNRPDKTAEVFRAIRKLMPSRLFVVADGPRGDADGDARSCEEVRRLIRDGVDWDCDFVPLFRPENLGCRQSVSQGISWFFEQVPEGIILEDDTLPSDSFFSYCRELLGKYRDEPDVMHMGGDNFQFGRKRGAASYYASKYPHIWGWATWRRAWRHYDADMPTFSDRWSTIEEKWITRQEERDLWKNYFQMVLSREVDTWDFQWVYTLFSRCGVSLLPNRNLVTNIGFGSGATHTVQEESLLNGMSVEELGPLTHPKSLRVDHAADGFTLAHVFLGRPLSKMNWREHLENLKWSLRNR